jgi:NAD(P)-dependent dehydrogenase (short-subunit alcohol dehydrogenase family)
VPASSKVAFITGGGRGFGRAFAIALASQGWRVAVAARSPDQVEETAQMTRAASGGEAIAITADVTSRHDVQAMVRRTESELGQIELLINNAGQGRPYGPTWDTDPDEWWSAIETNLRGPMLCCSQVLPGMIRARRGRIINVASGAGTFSIPYMSAYVTGKTALIRFTEVLADETRQHGVSVFAIQPGTVMTEMAKDAVQSEWLPWLRRIFEEGRGDTFEPGTELTELMLYLASGQADALSGRMFMAPGTPPDIAARAAEIQAQELHVLRLRT